jgi:hypothetical protein
MKTQHSEACRTDPNCELRAGDSSWDEGKKSFKYAWFTANGNAARGGEFPVEALPQFVEMSVRCNYRLMMLDAHGNAVPGSEVLIGLLQGAIRSGCRLAFA